MEASQQYLQEIAHSRRFFPLRGLVVVILLYTSGKPANWPKSVQLDEIYSSYRQARYDLLSAVGLDKHEYQLHKA